jgi:hypothetical protein
MTPNTSTSEQVPRRPGRLSRLDSFQAPSGPIHSLPTEYLNDLQWFARYGAFIVRDGCGDEACAIDLEVDLAMVQQIGENLERLSKTHVYDQFVSYPGSTKKIPPFPREESYQDAISISRALMRTANKDPVLVRTAVSAYANGVRTRDRLLVLTAPEHARFGRALIDLVRLLNLKWLRWRIVCFKTGNAPQKSIREEWRKGLGLPSNTQIHWVAAKNKLNAASANHIAVEVIERHGRLQEVSSNFHSVMLFGNVVEIWRLVS